MSEVMKNYAAIVLAAILVNNYCLLYTSEAADEILGV